VNLLAIETATPACAIALRANGRDASAVLDTARHHTETLTAGIEAMLAAAGIAVGQLERVVVDRGPGLFTGLRVGLATAQALAWGLGVELVGVSSLELLALGAHRSGVRGELVALVDARRGELFAQRFALAESVLARDEPAVTSPTALAGLAGAARLVATGDGAVRYREVLVAAGVTVLDESVPPALEALELGARRLAAPVAPLYLREADAVANFATRERPR
jgi:tRNA threonylcarbamoyl adenosine modification protein YeaZ